MASKAAVEEDKRACDDGLTFVNLYYDTIDRKRDKLGFLYSQNNPTVVWNGNCVTGNSDITQLMLSLPKMDHQIHSVDSQSIEIAPEAGMRLVQVSGSMNLEGVMHAFTQTFVLAPEDGKMRVQSDRMRFID